MPPGFTWVDPPRLAALAMPDEDDLHWLRRSGIDVVLTLTEDPLPRRWVNDAGLISVHIPIVDMEAPSLEQMEVAVQTIERTGRAGMAVAVHCFAGRGRTGTILAAYFVNRGMTGEEAIQHVRKLRQGSIETVEQEDIVKKYANSRS